MIWILFGIECAAFLGLFYWLFRDVLSTVKQARSTAAHLQPVIQDALSLAKEAQPVAQRVQALMQNAQVLSFMVQETQAQTKLAIEAVGQVGALVTSAKQVAGVAASLLKKPEPPTKMEKLRRTAKRFLKRIF